MRDLKKYFPAIALLFFLFNLKAQFSGYTFCEWELIKVDPEFVPASDDTLIIFASVRNYSPGKPQCLDYDLDTSKTLHYFSIYFNRNKWICVPRKSLEEAFEGASKNKDVVVYGEGMGKTFTENVDRSTRLTRIYNVTTVMFDWPTYRPFLSGGKNYKRARIQSTSVARSLCNLFSELEKIKPSLKADSLNLSLLLHSLGNRLIKEAVINDFIVTKTKLFDNVILNAACVKMRRHRKWLEKLTIQDKIYLTRNNKDRTLLLAKLAGLTEQLGRRSALRKAKNAIYLNFSPVLEKEHNYFLMTNVLRNHPELKIIYSDIFHGRTINFSDEKKFISQKNGRVITLKGPERLTQQGDISLGVGM
jgi:hypothetical protein